MDLHQRLSEFSYGYGVTREVEKLLDEIGIQTVPFLPSLPDEATKGYDVAFEKPGLPLLLQFKLGEAMKRFRRSPGMSIKPLFKAPIWRFVVDTAESNGQFDLLLKADGAAEVYYVAPRFSNWRQYAKAYKESEILKRSILIRPSAIDDALNVQGQPAGPHRVVYDSDMIYVCSNPEPVEETSLGDLGKSLRARIIQSERSLGDGLKAMYEDLSELRARRPRTPDTSSSPKESVQRRLAIEGRQTGRVVQPRLDLPELRQVQAPVVRDYGIRHQITVRDREASLQRYSDKERDSGAAHFEVLGMEMWAAGSQLIVATLED